VLLSVPSSRHPLSKLTSALQTIYVVRIAP
jgi:hypothetical protein